MQLAWEKEKDRRFSSTTLPARRNRRGRGRRQRTVGASGPPGGSAIALPLSTYRDTCMVY